MLGKLCSLLILALPLHAQQPQRVATPASGGAGLAQLRAIQTADLPSALTPASVAVGAATSTLYRCVGGTDDGFLVWKTSVCTGAGGTTTSTAITTP
jgi:hypothetical protein